MPRVNAQKDFSFFPTVCKFVAICLYLYLGLIIYGLVQFFYYEDHYQGICYWSTALTGYILLRYKISQLKKFGEK